MPRPKKFDVLVDRVNTFLADQENVENLWRYVLEQQKSLEQSNYGNYDTQGNYGDYGNHGNYGKQKRGRKTEL